MKSGYTVIEENDGILYTHGLWPDLYSAIGSLVCHIHDDEEDLAHDNYITVEKDDFADKEGENGYVWTRTYQQKKEDGSEGYKYTVYWMVVETIYDFKEHEDA